MPWTDLVTPAHDANIGVVSRLMTSAAAALRQAENSSCARPENQDATAENGLTVTVQ